MDYADQSPRIKFSPAVENAFQEDYLHNTPNNSSRIGLMMGVFIITILGVLDYWAMPETFRTAWIIRAAIMIPPFLITATLTYWSGVRKVWQWLASYCIVATGVGITLTMMVTQPGEIAFSHYYTGLLFMAVGSYAFTRIQFRYALAANLLVFVFYEVCAIFWQKLPSSGHGELFIQINIVYLIGLFSGSGFGYIIERHRRRDFIQRYELRQRNIDLDAYAHTVAHDLKSPLSAIIGMAMVLRDNHQNIPSDKLEASLNQISMVGMKMTSIIVDMLALASVRRQKDVEAELLNMDSIVDDVLMWLEYTIEESDARVVKSDRWPPAMGYAPWIESIWLNLISNAVKYGGNPPVVELGNDQCNNGMVKYWVRDNGNGLTKEEQARLFTEFEQLDTSTPGHGLGLSIVKRTVEQMGGEVGVDSLRGEGSTFWFCLPAAA